jgi:peroxiredoxin
MSKTPSNMPDLGFKSPYFSLLNPIDKTYVNVDDIQGEHGTLVMFICNHCPYVITIMDTLSALCTKYQQQGIGVVAISSNDIIDYPLDAPEKMVDLSSQYAFTFPYLYDEKQTVAKAYYAACTPDFFLFDKDRKCIYRGQFDDSRPQNSITPSGHDLNKAIHCLLTGQPLNFEQIPSLGCNIKWK